MSVNTRRIIMGLLLLCLVGCRTFVGVPLSATRDLRRLYASCSAFAEDHEGRLPDSMGEMAAYIGERRFLKEYELVASGYFADLQLSASTPVFRTAHRNWDGEYVAVFGDGRCGKLQGNEKK